MTPLLRAEGLTLRQGDRLLVDRLDLRVMPGQCWVVLGPNGTGKSTLLQTLAGLQTPASGTIHLAAGPLTDLPPRIRAHHLGLLLQQDNIGLHNSTLELALTGSYPRKRHWWDTAEEIAAARQALSAVDLADRAGQTTDTLSGGELRRAQIARLLVQDPEIALLDEPLANLDIAQQARIARLLRGRFTVDGRALMMVLHDLDLAARLASHCLLLDGEGGWQAGPAAEVATPENLGKLFGQPLLRGEGPRGPLLAVDWEG